MWLYKAAGVWGKGTNAVIESVHFGKDVPVQLVPVIFLATVLTHLCGGSAGREGAALQIGGGIGHETGKLLHLGEKDLPLATLCGMSGRVLGSVRNAPHGHGFRPRGHLRGRAVLRGAGAVHHLGDWWGISFRSADGRPADALYRDGARAERVDDGARARCSASAARW